MSLPVKPTRRVLPPERLHQAQVVRDVSELGNPPGGQVSMNVQAASKHFRVHPTTVRRWVSRGCPTLELGGVGRGHRSRLDPQSVERWLVEQRVPSASAQAEQDVLAIVATALYDVLKRDGLEGQILAAERVVLMIYERLYRNVKQTPLQVKDLPDEMKRVCFNYLEFVEHGHFQRR